MVYFFKLLRCSEVNGEGGLGTTGTEGAIGMYRAGGHGAGPQPPPRVTRKVFFLGFARRETRFTGIVLYIIHIKYHTYMAYMTTHPKTPSLLIPAHPDGLLGGGGGGGGGPLSLDVDESSGTF